MLEKFAKIKNLNIHNLRDPRSIGLIVFGFISLLVTWNTLDAIQTNYTLQKQIARIEQQTKIHELENANLKLKNEYLNTDQYLELTARRQFGKALEGEKVLLVPKEVALSKTVDVKEGPPISADEPSHKPFYQRNFEAWMEFLFHRSR